ncbi:MAG: ankyrin repeat domain-containing protein [Verrucomicrobiota bacterium]
MLNFPCPHCGVNIAAEPQYSGTSSNCPSCGNELTAPVLLVPKCANASPQVVADPAATEDPLLINITNPANRGSRRTLLTPKQIMVGIVALILASVILRMVFRPGSELVSEDIPEDLSQCCSQGDLAKVTVLTIRSKMGILYDVNQPGADGFPIIAATEKGHVEVVKLLIEKDAKLDQVDGWGRYPIHAAAESGSLEIFKALEDGGADINQKSGIPHNDEVLMEISRSQGNEYQPIHSAAKLGKIEIVKYLVSRGVSPDAKDNRGMTSYDYAYIEGKTPDSEHGKNCAEVMKFLKTLEGE